MKSARAGMRASLGHCRDGWQRGIALKAIFSSQKGLRRAALVSLRRAGFLRFRFGRCRLLRACRHEVRYQARMITSRLTFPIDIQNLFPPFRRVLATHHSLPYATSPWPQAPCATVLLVRSIELLSPLNADAWYPCPHPRLLDGRLRMT